MDATTPITTRLDAVTLETLDRLAERYDRSRSWLVAQAVRQFVEREAEMLAIIEEGERSAREEPLISHEEMKKLIAAKRAELRSKHDKATA
ncbi:CopG family ribbon-helix-helix protein [Sphingopyxis alaskensis]|jgi:predicted transcriptional regulator|uniref:Transcriptional regulator, CopG family n=1 Tax=Sphingopyxis alaskensis (strain DSM 13593 / LMG 18877 / RB2256) TaxID=317655 RepID=Q1GVM1_SPHAL|nr:ribbon-helix-helix protein, CopG family [Sphingopyxis alaskensis]ABF52301.1 transcriptional regulator, CopG family [Sphingopyxis alaskensis RB2256]MCM3420423.1 ribbon-helix-helix protein, CopG family [Sphingopyxis alaskensis]